MEPATIVSKGKLSFLKRGLFKRSCVFLSDLQKDDLAQLINIYGGKNPKLHSCIPYPSHIISVVSARRYILK
jgi:hypothetical protein